MWRTSDCLARVQESLDAQQEMLMSGQLTDLARMSESIASLMNELSEVGDDKLALERVRATAERNRRLLANAIRAVKEVTSRLTRGERAQQGFTTYSALGTARKVGATHVNLIKKL